MTTVTLTWHACKYRKYKVLNSTTVQPLKLKLSKNRKKEEEKKERKKAEKIFNAGWTFVGKRHSVARIIKHGVRQRH